MEGGPPPALGSGGMEGGDEAEGRGGGTDGPEGLPGTVGRGGTLAFLGIAGNVGSSGAELVGCVALGEAKSNNGLDIIGGAKVTGPEADVEVV